MNDKLPSCPLHPADRDIVKQYLQREQELQSMTEQLRVRSFGQRILRSAQLRLAISQYTGMQTEARSVNPEILSAESIKSYTDWVEALSRQLEKS